MKRLVLGIAILCAAARPSQAQERPANGDRAGQEATGWLTLAKGTRVRLMVEDRGPMREVVGRLLASDADTVTVDALDGPQRLSRDRLFHVQYLAPGRDRAKGALIGAAVTGSVGFVAGLVIGLREAQKPFGCEECGLFVGLVALVSAVTAAAPGGAIGFAIGAPSTDWRGAKPTGLTVARGGERQRGMKAELRLQFGHRGRR